jgi:glycosyltransferase involved in cell wall biosynthesis
MNKKQSVAVIIPFYNGMRWIERAVKSVAGQTVIPDEFIVVNDGSKPEERIALDHLAMQYGFRIIDKSNGGQGSARNAGVAASTSNYLCFLDQDDFYLPNHIEDLVTALPEKDLKFGFVYADLNIADGDGGLIFTTSVKEHSPANPKRSLIDLLRADMFVLPSASIVGRTAFESVGGFDPQFMGYEDDDLFLRIFRNGFSNYYLDKPVTVWCIHGESTSYSIRMSRSRFKYFMKLTELYPDNPDRGLYFFRDCIAPRFGRAFLADAVKATSKRSPDKVELVKILCDYTDMLGKNENVRRTLKFKFSIISAALTYSPLWALKAMRYATFVPSIRRRLVT